LSDNLVRPRRGEVWKVDLNPTKGSEIYKIRPAVVVSSDAISNVLPIKVVVPITGWKDGFEEYLWLVKLEPDGSNGLGKVSAANALQIRAIGTDSGRFLEKLGQIPLNIMDEIAAAVAIVVEYQ